MTVEIKKVQRQIAQVNGTASAVTNLKWRYLMKKRLLTLAAGLLSAAALTSSGGIAHAQMNCYYMPIVEDCYDLAIDCQCIDIVEPRDALSAPPSNAVETSTVRQSIGW